jgi:hypothetical protein
MDHMKHIEHLTRVIGPRGSTTEKEAEASRYAAEAFTASGLSPTSETFLSAKSGWYPYALFSGLIILSTLLHWYGGKWGTYAAIALVIFALVSVVFELAFRNNPIRMLLPKSRSQNVWALIPSQGESRETVVLIGHVDTHRTPLVFSTDTWVKIFGTLVPIGLVASIILLAVFITSLFIHFEYASLITSIFLLVIIGIFVLTLQADLTPYTQGANDNATGAGIVLNLAERLHEEPLRNTSVYALISGCEEVGCYGADAFVKTHANSLGNAIWITLDTLGSANGDPYYLKKETMLLTSHSDPHLLEMAESTSQKKPSLNVKPYSGFSGAYTEGAIGSKYGLRVLTLIALTSDGKLPGWHRPTDTYENIDPDTVLRSQDFVWYLLQNIDSQAAN